MYQTGGFYNKLLVWVLLKMKCRETVDSDTRGNGKKVWISLTERH